VTCADKVTVKQQKARTNKMRMFFSPDATCIGYSKQNVHSIS
jgi:hypothetical protein